MSKSLSRITEEEWLAKARAANYHVSPLAKLCGVSVRTLERHIKQCQAKSAHVWLNVLRMTEARVFMLDGNSVKESAAMLGYMDASQFSKDFKQCHGTLPSRMAKLQRQPQEITPLIAVHAHDFRERLRRSQREAIQSGGVPLHSG